MASQRFVRAPCTRTALVRLCSVRSASPPAVLRLRAFPLFLLLGALLLLAGCTSFETRKVVDLSAFQHIYVEHRLTDDRRLDETIVQELTRLGYVASRGPLTMMPNDADAVLTYEDRWEWDFKTYLIEFNVVVRTARTKKQLAYGRFYQPTPNSKAPAEVVAKVLTPLFAKQSPADTKTPAIR
jgi:hypothetical protein